MADKPDGAPRPAAAIKRFYETVSVAPAEGGHAILLDGRPVNTPQRARLVVPRPQLAADIAGEWDAQGENIVPHDMPLTRLANSAIDRVGAEREGVITEIAGYCGSDLLCYRAEAPAELSERQNAAWDPVVRWAETLAGCRLALAAGVVHVAQPDAALEALAARIAAHDDFSLAALSMATTMTGSAILALALAHGHIGPDAAWAAAHVDEDWQISLWGEDAEAAARRARLERDFMAAARVLDIMRT